jgi:hypothetical protein
MSNCYRGPSKDASYQVSVHLAKQLQRKRFFRNQPIRNKNCLWWPCLLTDRDEISNLYRGHSIDASCRVSVNLAKRFQRRRFKKIYSVTCLYYALHVGIHILIFFLAHLANGNVGFWHHLAFIVCCLSSVNFSHFKDLP